MTTPTSTLVLAFTVMLAAACDDLPCADCAGPCVGDGACTPSCGEVRLKARTKYDDYEAATVSFTHATVKDSDLVRNDWDLLFGNGGDRDKDHFCVNMVTDDRSFIVDLGPLSICDVPGKVDPTSYPVGLFGEHDDIPVVKDHLYFIRTEDSDTRQSAVALVLEHQLKDTVTLRWYRSPDPERFVPPSACSQ